METEKQKKGRKESDLNIIRHLRKHGSNLSKPHHIEHHFVIKNKHNIAKINDNLIREGYEKTEVYEGIDEDGEAYFSINCYKYCLLEPRIIFEESRKMTEVALSYNELYDGWGTMVVL